MVSDSMAPQQLQASMLHLGGASTPTLDRHVSAGSFLNLGLLRRSPTRAEHATGGPGDGLSNGVLGLWEAVHAPA